MSNEIVIPTTVAATAKVDSQLSGLTGGRNTFDTSIDKTTEEGQFTLLNALSDSEQIADHLGETLMLKDYIAQIVEYEDTATGELMEGIRIIIVDDKGVGYSALSTGFYRSMMNILNVKGSPRSWAKPLPIRVDEVKGKRGKYYSIRLVKADEGFKASK